SGKLHRVRLTVSQMATGRGILHSPLTELGSRRISATIKQVGTGFSCRGSTVSIAIHGSVDGGDKPGHDEGQSLHRLALVGVALEGAGARRAVVERAGVRRIGHRIGRVEEKN